MPNIGPLEIVIVLIIVLVIFGPKRLPSLGRSLGTGMREFKDSITGKGEDDEPRSELEPSDKVDATEQPSEEPDRAGAGRGKPGDVTS